MKSNRLVSLIENGDQRVWEVDREQEFPTLFAIVGNKRFIIDADEYGKVSASIYPNVEDWYDRNGKSRRIKTASIEDLYRAHQNPGELQAKAEAMWASSPFGAV